MFRRLRKWYLCRKYGICPTHLTLLVSSSWCRNCQREAGEKHWARQIEKESIRRKALAVVDELSAKETP